MEVLAHVFFSCKFVKKLYYSTTSTNLSELLKGLFPVEFIIVGRVSSFFFYEDIAQWVIVHIRCVIFYSMTLSIYTCEALVP